MFRCVLLFIVLLMYGEAYSICGGFSFGSRASLSRLKIKKPDEVETSKAKENKIIFSPEFREFLSKRVAIENYMFLAFSKKYKEMLDKLDLVKLEEDNLVRSINIEEKKLLGFLDEFSGFFYRDVEGDRRLEEGSFDTIEKYINKEKNELVKFLFFTLFFHKFIKEYVNIPGELMGYTREWIVLVNGFFQKLEKKVDPNVGLIIDKFKKTEEILGFTSILGEMELEVNNCLKAMFGDFKSHEHGFDTPGVVNSTQAERPIFIRRRSSIEKIKLWIISLSPKLNHHRLGD